VNMSNIIDLVYDTDIFLASPHPLPDGALSQGNKDPWSLSGCHPTSRPYLVIHCHPSHEGYDNSLCLEDCGADFGFLAQQPVVSPWFGYGNDHVTHQCPKGWSTCHGRHPVPALLTRAPVHATFGLEGALLPDPQPNPQPPTVGTTRIPQETQFSWDSKTGSRLTSARTKRRQSEEERAGTQKIISQGGSCDACRRGHRKVPCPNATILSPY
jgi:hypothetical protein